MTILLIIVAVVLAPVVVIFVCGVIQGWRKYQPPPPIPLRTLWYDLVWGPKPKPKPKRRFRVLWPPPKEEER
jgi:hypothetical protein